MLINFQVLLQALLHFGYSCGNEKAAASKPNGTMRFRALDCYSESKALLFPRKSDVNSTTK